MSDDLSKDRMLSRLWRFFFPPKRKRLGLIFVNYEAAEKYLQKGWTIAPEEDWNKIIGWVHLELLEPRK